ncbi:hypothetical protein CANARDRAFT_26528 [[Candida] arabinofermentans NRRL YB-2248]|uniref:Uncharacterized protein n=1 Tax=[Candida] arabinofermentans NRRL YB-2248 TaxID=983967 RepID=A0A1E4T5T5_9ASCO|nr:hypothetical protein CANARDRAFT_26528 [[Candida] arabinofermentans NRRL YB-2248]
MGDLELIEESLRKIFDLKLLHSKEVARQELEKKLEKTQEDLRLELEKKLTALEVAKDEEMKQFTVKLDELKLTEEGNFQFNEDLGDPILNQIKRMFPRIRLDLDESGTSSAEEQKLVDDYNPNYEEMETFGLVRDPKAYEQMLVVQERFKDRGIPERSWMPLFLKYHVTARLCYDAKDSKNWNELMIKVFENYDFDTKEDQIRYHIHTFTVNPDKPVKEQLLTWANLGLEHHTLGLLDAQRLRYARFLKEHNFSPLAISAKKLRDYEAFIKHINDFAPPNVAVPDKTLVDDEFSSTSFALANKEKYMRNRVTPFGYSR